MDSFSSSSSTPSQTQLDLSRLSDAEKRELEQGLKNELQKAKIQDSVHNLTDICWTKCVAANKISGGALTGSEETCTQNCVDRFLDANTSVLRHLEMMRGGGGL